MLLADARCLADSAVAAVAYRAVALNLADGTVAAITHGTVALYLADSAVAAVTDGTIALYLADGTVAGIADGAVALYLADGAVAAVTDSAIALYLADRTVACIADCLCLRHAKGKACETNKNEFLHSCDNCLVLYVLGVSRELLSHLERTKFPQGLHRYLCPFLFLWHLFVESILQDRLFLMRKVVYARCLLNACIPGKVTTFLTNKIDVVILIAENILI